MSSPATTIEKSDEAKPDNTLLVIPDGSPLWLTPDPESPEHMLFGWRSEAILALIQQLPCTSNPILVGAPDISSTDLVTLKSGYIYAWHEWEMQYGIPAGLNVMVRPMDNSFLPLSHGNSASTKIDHQLWLVAKESFYDGTLQPGSCGWARTFRRLGFRVHTWANNQSLTWNLKEKRLAHAVPSPTRPTSITVGTLVELELATTCYKIND